MAYTYTPSAFGEKIPHYEVFGRPANEYPQLHLPVARFGNSSEQDEVRSPYNGASNLANFTLRRALDVAAGHGVEDKVVHDLNTGSLDLIAEFGTHAVMPTSQVELKAIKRSGVDYFVLRAFGRFGGGGRWPFTHQLGWQNQRGYQVVHALETFPGAVPSEPVLVGPREYTRPLTNADYMADPSLRASALFRATEQGLLDELVYGGSFLQHFRFDGPNSPRLS